MIKNMQDSPKTENIIKEIASNALFFGGAIFTGIMFMTSLIAVGLGDFEILIPLLSIMVVMGMAPMYIGWKGRKKNKIKKQQANIKKLETNLFKLAKNCKGTLNRSTVAMKLSITVDEAEEILLYATSKNLAKTQYDDEGNIIYVFPDFLPRG